ncbi:MAG: transposase [Clostridia bacterium]|nr:transposase [Clostridia bacterium]MBQ8925862.1 transposase [Clostridia bacterium]
MAHKAYKYRIYPNEMQAKQIERTFGCCRFVYNKMLSLQNERYEQGEAFLSKFKANNYCNHVLKNEYEFLKEVDKFALTNSILNLDHAFRNFFDFKARYPKFKCKRTSTKSYTTNFTNGNIAVLDNAIKLPKLKAVKAKIHRPIPGGWTIKGATITQTPAGEYYCSILLEYDHVVSSTKTHQKPIATGLDYKSDGLYVEMSGRVCGSPKHLQKSLKRIAIEQKKLSRKKHGSKNYEKQRLRLAKQHRHIANQRKDHLHKESLFLAKKYDIVCVETLNMRNISNKKFHIGMQTMDNGYGMFLEMLEYKLSDRGGELIKVDKFYPSSQLCSLCGLKNPSVKKLKVRYWECPNCHAIHYRDINAATNIYREGLRIYSERRLISA